MEARVDPNTWARIEKDRERERDGKGGKESGRSPEAREMGFHVEGQWVLSADMLENGL